MQRLVITLTIICAIGVLGEPFGWAGSGTIQPSCTTPKKVQGILTCADLAKAEREGSVVLYSPDIEMGTVAMLNAFHTAFPKIQTNYVRLQTGALYAKITSERAAGHYLADAMIIGDQRLTMDFLKKGGYAQYVSPENAAYQPAFMSSPPGYFTWYALVIVTMTYNPKVTPAAEAPKTWKDVLNPRWKDGVSVKSLLAGSQHLQWFELRRLYGDNFWKEFAALNPRVFESVVQQLDRLAAGEDTLAFNTQYSGYLLYKAKGSPLEVIYPPEGLMTQPETLGVVSNAPHPEAAKLLVDWLLGRPGQESMMQALYMNSARTDVPAPPGGRPTGELKLLYPANWDEVFATTGEFQRVWNRLSGLQ
jgi:iron(III) transport system substrate-binding protein